MTSIGDNGKLSADDRRKLFAHHTRKLIAAELARRAAVAEITAIKKLAKAEDETFTAAKFAHYLKVHFGEDDQKAVDRWKSDQQNLIWLGLIPDTQGDLLAQIDRVDREGMIRAKGYEAGLLGRDRVSKYDAGSVDDKLWLESYDAGKAEFETQIPDIIARVQAEADHEEPPASDPFAASVH